MSLTESNPGSILEIRQIHNKGIAVEGKIYYGRAEDGSVHTYRGTFEGRLREEATTIKNEKNIDTAQTDIISNDVDIVALQEEDIRLEAAKADKCFAIAMSIIL